MENETTQKRKPENVPYVVFDDMVANYQWIIKKLVWALIVAIVLLFVSNVVWILEWCSYDYDSAETTLESDGDNNNLSNYMLGDGGVIYGSKDYSTKEDAN